MVCIMSMRRLSYLFLGILAVMTVSCKNAGALGENSKDKDVIDSAKTVIAADILDLLDEYAAKYIELSDSAEFEASDIISRNLSEKDRLVKPDYLLDPQQAKLLVTRSQKINALAILSTELPLRKAFGMPSDEASNEIAALSAALNFPAYYPGDGECVTVSDAIKAAYEQFKEHKALTDFWRYVCSMQNSLLFLMANNVDTFSENVTKEEYDAIQARLALCVKAADLIAKEDREVANAEYTLGLYGKFDSQEEALEYYSDLENFKQSLIEGKAYYTARRAGILK